MKEKKNVMYWEDIGTLFLIFLFIAVCFFGSSGIVLSILKETGLHYGGVCVSLMLSMVFCSLLGLNFIMYLVTK